MLQIGICDDEPLLLEIIEKTVKRCLTDEQIFAVTATFTSGQNLIYEIQDGKRFDLLLLDIEMPEISGMELARRIHELSPGTLMIFVTAHYKYAVDAYELNIFRYIPKNQLEQRLPHALRDASSILEIQNTDSYIISCQNRLERLPMKNILYIGKDGKNAVFHMESEHKEVRVRKTLTEVFEELNPHEFYFIERGFIVNLRHISGITQTDCILTDGTALPVAQSRLTDFKKKLNVFWRNKI